MKYEEAFKYFKRGLFEGKVGKGSIQKEAFFEAMKAIEKQIPSELKGFETRDGKFIGYTCPRCEAFYSNWGQFLSSDYCPNCGQRVVRGYEE